MEPTQVLKTFTLKQFHQNHLWSLGASLQQVNVAS